LCYCYFILHIFFYLFFFFCDSLRIDHRLTDFGGYPKSFQPSPEKRARGQDGDNELGDLWGPVKVARASVYLICAPFAAATIAITNKNDDTALGRAAEVSLLSMCTLLSHIYDPKVPHPQYPYPFPRLERTPRVPDIIRQPPPSPPPSHYYYNY
jgi:hypothetical protein